VRRLTTALVTAALVAVPAAAAPARHSDSAAPLVFASDRDPNLDATKLYTVTVATRKLRLLTPNGFLDTGAAWWPGGRRIVVARTRGSSSYDFKLPPEHLVLVDAASGRTLRTLTNGRGESCPAPSPNGRWLAYCESLARSANGEMRVARADGSGAHRVPGTTGHWPLGDNWRDTLATIAWAPDSSAVAIALHPEAPSSVTVVVSPAGRVLHRIRGALLAWTAPRVIAVGRTANGFDYVALVTPAGKLLRRVRGAAATELGLAALHRPGTNERICLDDDRQLALCVSGTRVRRALTPLAAGEAEFAARAWSPDGRRLLYTDSVTVCFADVFETVPGSGVVRRLAGGPYEEDAPALSPDGGSVAFVRATGETTRSFVRHLPDGPTVRLGGGWSPSWSPDGSLLALASGHGLFVVSADGRNRRAVASGYFQSVDWSPDGRTLVATRGGESPELVTVPAAGGDVHSLGLEGDDPAWSPDSTRIAFSSGGIWVAAADGSGAVQITRVGQNFGNNINEDVHPTWSPDGTEIAFASGVSLGEAVDTGVICPGECPPDFGNPEPYVIAAVRPDGSNEHVLIQGPGADFDPSWD
jgi:Tol biopolymer transport system component